MTGVWQLGGLIDEPGGKETVEISVCRIRPDAIDTAFTVELIRAPAAERPSYSPAQNARPVSMPVTGAQELFAHDVATRLSAPRCLPPHRPVRVACCHLFLNAQAVV